MTKKEDAIRSEEVQDVLNAVPNWMIRWGISLIFIILMIGLFLSWLIRYPQTLTGEAIITTQTPPVNLVTRVNGRIVNIYQEDGADLKAGDPIAEIESATRLENVHFIQSFLQQMELQSYLELDLRKIDTNIAFGDAQQGVNLLIKALYDYQHFKEDKELEIKAGFLKQKIQLQQELVALQQDQVKVLRSELKNKEEKHAAMQQLYADSSIARFEWLQVENEYSQKLRESQSLEKQLVQNRFSLVELNEQFNALQLNAVQSERTLLESIDSQKRNLTNMVEQWQQSYVIAAPGNGKLAYVKNIHTNDYVTMGEELFAVFSDNDSLYAYAKVTALGAGKLKAGQEVRINLNAFPREEFGIIEGKVASVAPLTSQSAYFVRIMLSNELTTSYQKEIPFRPELAGTIEIIVDKRRLIYRVFDSIYQLFDDINA